MKENNSPAPTLYSKLYHSALLVILSIVMLFVNYFKGRSRDYSYPIEQNEKVATNIIDATSYKISNECQFTFKDIPFIKSFLYPRYQFLTDTFYLAAVGLISLLIILLILREHRKGIFNAKLSRLTHLLAYYFVAILVLNTARWFYVMNKVSLLTDGKYKVINWGDLLLRPEFWMVAIFGVITFILKKGEKLQEEQHLTI